MRTLLVATALTALPLPALAGPWTYEVADHGNNSYVVNAYPEGSDSDAASFGYNCLTDEKVSKFYIVTRADQRRAEPYPDEATAMVVVDGDTLKIKGLTLVDSGALIITLSEAVDPEVNTLFDALTETKAPVEVSVLDIKLTVPVENAFDALNIAYDRCFNNPPQ